MSTGNSDYNDTKASNVAFKNVYTDIPLSFKEHPVIKDIRPISNATELLKQIRGVTYRFKVNEFKDKRFPKELQIGVIAQEVNNVFPQAIETDEDGFLYVSYMKLNAILIEAFRGNILALNRLLERSGGKIDVANETLFLFEFYEYNVTVMDKIVEKCNGFFQKVFDPTDRYFFMALVLWLVYFYYIVSTSK